VKHAFEFRSGLHADEFQSALVRSGGKTCGAFGSGGACGGGCGGDD